MQERSNGCACIGSQSDQLNPSQLPCLEWKSVASADFQPQILQYTINLRTSVCRGFRERKCIVMFDIHSLSGGLQRLGFQVSGGQLNTSRGSSFENILLPIVLESRGPVSLGRRTTNTIHSLWLTVLDNSLKQIVPACTGRASPIQQNLGHDE